MPDENPQEPLEGLPVEPLDDPAARGQPADDIPLAPLSNEPVAAPQPVESAPAATNSGADEYGISAPEPAPVASSAPKASAPLRSPLAETLVASPSAAPVPAAPASPAAAHVEWLSDERPEVAQTLRNIRVWLPFLANPIDRRLQVRFAPDDDRVGLTWKVAFPRLCWHCAAAEALSPRVYEGTLRSFEYPLGIVVGAGAAAFVSVLIALAWPMTGIVMFLLSLVIGAAVLWLKSWTEEVQLTMWTCPAHSGPMKVPGMVIDDQHLHVTLAHADVVAATNDDIRERRRTSAGRKMLGAGGGGASNPPRRPASEELPPVPVYRPAPTKPVDLPPIKLAGDEE